MARVASFTSAGTPTGARNTLAQLMSKRKMLLEQQGEITAPRPIEHWMQGVGQLAQTAVNALQQRGAAQEETAGREQLAGAMSGINWDTGPTPEQLQTITQLDPDAGQRMTEFAANKALEELRHSRTLKEAEVSTLTPEEEVAAGLNPAGTYQKKSSGEIARITEPTAADEWVNIPAPEGSKPGQIFQQNATTKEIRSVGGSGITIQNEQPVPAEIAARIALGDEFLGNFESIKQVAEAGGLSGPIDITTAAAGRGPEGAAYRQIQAGIDAVRRNLTGAGMSATEADEYASRYLPGYRDDAATVTSKLQQLHDHLTAIRTGVTTGRKAAPAPGETAPAPAQTAPTTTAPTEEDQPPPKVGDEVEGYIYTGGDPNDPRSYKPKGAK